MKAFLAVLAVIGAALALPAQASTSLLTSEAGYTGPQLDLSAYANGNYNFTFGPEPIPGGITFVAAPGGGGNSGQGSVLGQGGYGLAGNGSFGADAVYAGVDSGTGYADFRLSAPVNMIGFFFNYAPGVGNPPTISSLDSAFNVVDSYDLSVLAPISTPGGFNQFAFRGIASTATDIFGLRMGGSYILASGTATGDIPGPPAPAPGVPEPATWAMLIMGFGAIGAVMRGSRRRQALSFA